MSIFIWGDVGGQFGIMYFNCLGYVCLFCLCLCSYSHSFRLGLRVLGCLSFVSCFRVVLGSMCE